MAVDENTIAAAAAELPGVLTGALGDSYASGEYRRHLAMVLARRALTMLRMRVNEAKTQVIHAEEGFAFLGATFENTSLSLPSFGSSM